MKRLYSLIAASSLLAAGTAFAMDTTAWDFRGGNAPQGLSPQGLTTVEATDEGLYVETQTDGYLQLPALTGRADTLRLTITNAQRADLALIWRTPDLNPGEYYQQTISVPAGESQEATVMLTDIPEWTWSAPFIGIAFPAGSRMLIETAEWNRYGGAEKVWNGIVSFWTPDRFQLYSINFLWGPLIATTTEGIDTLFDRLPPPFWSATRFFYGFLALAAMVAGGWWIAEPAHGRRRFLLVLAIAGSATWIVFDLRMTQEILSYVRDDWRSYVLLPPEERTLRSHANLYDVLATSKPLLGEDARYVLVAQENTPFFQNARYYLLPAVPVLPNEPHDGVAAWLVLARSDVRAQSGALVQSDGTVLARGSVVHRFDDSSFFFRAEP